MSKRRLFIDVREPFEYNAGHVIGALNIPPTEMLAGARKLQKIDKGTELVLYCRTGSRSLASIQILRQLGFTNLVNGINTEHVTKTYFS